DVVTRRCQLGLVLRLGGGLFGPLLLDIRIERDQLGATVERIALLLLSVELDEQVARLDTRARFDKSDDEQWRKRSLQPGHDDAASLHGLDRSGQADHRRRCDWIR